MIDQEYKSQESGSLEARQFQEASTDPQRALKLFLAMLFSALAAVTVALMLFYFLSGRAITGDLICGAPLTLALAGFAVFQAYRGLVKRSLTLPLPRDSAKRRLYIRGKIPSRITGQAAVAVGVFWVLLALLFGGTAIRIIVNLLLSP